MVLAVVVAAVLGRCGALAPRAELLLSRGMYALCASEKEKEIVKKYDKKEVKLAKKNSKALEKVFKKINKQIGTRWH